MPAADTGEVAQDLGIRRCSGRRSAARSAVDGNVLEILHRVHLVLRRLRHDVVGHHVVPVEKEHGRDLKAAAQRVEHAGGNVLLGVPALRGLGAIHVHLKRGIVEGLLNAKVDEAGNLAQLAEHLVGLGLAGVRIVAFNLDVDGRGQSKVENLRGNVGGQRIKRGFGENAGQVIAQSAHIVCRWPVIRLERYQNVAIARAQRAIGQVLRVHARYRAGRCCRECCRSAPAEFLCGSHPQPDRTGERFLQCAFPIGART